MVGADDSNTTISCNVTFEGIPPVKAEEIRWSVESDSNWTVDLEHIWLSDDRLSLTILSVAKDHEVIYTCTAQNAAGLSTSANIEVDYERKSWAVNSLSQQYLFEILLLAIEMSKLLLLENCGRFLFSSCTFVKSFFFNILCFHHPDSATVFL